MQNVSANDTYCSPSNDESSCMNAEGKKYERNVGSASVLVYDASLALQHVLLNVGNW